MNESKKADAQWQRYAMNKRSDAAVKQAVFRNVRHFLDIPQSTMKDQRGQGLCVTEIHQETGTVGEVNTLSSMQIHIIAKFSISTVHAIYLLDRDLWGCAGNNPCKTLINWQTIKRQAIKQFVRCYKLLASMDGEITEMQASQSFFHLL